MSSVWATYKPLAGRRLSMAGLVHNPKALDLRTETGCVTEMFCLFCRDFSCILFGGVNASRRLIYINKRDNMFLL